MAHYSRPEEVLKHFKTLFQANKDALRIKYVATQDENLKTEYPSLEIAAGPMLREIHGTQKYLVTFEMSFWVYHANMESTHASRTIEDMEIATDIVRFLHKPENRTLLDPTNPDLDKKRIIFGWVTQEIPGAIARTERSSIIVTRLVWNGQAEVLFEDA